MLMLGQTNIKLEAYGYAIADATKAIEIDPTFIKVLQSDTCLWAVSDRCRHTGEEQ